MVALSPALLYKRQSGRRSSLQLPLERHLSTDIGDPAPGLAAQDPILLRDRIIAEAKLLFERAEVEAAVGRLRGLEYATIDETTIRLTDAFFRPWIVGDRKVVATFDPQRRPAQDEIVIIYGNYPHLFENLIINNPVKRHVASYWDLSHDHVEYDKRWEDVEKIYIINGDDRPDRYDSILRELALASAPFHRIERIGAVIERADKPRLAGTIGCLTNHLKILRHAISQGYAHILVLEDDFTFTSDVHRHLEDMREFFGRRYAYWICLLATSKYGPILPKDDLVSVSLQKCTNAAAFLVSRDGLEELLPVQEHALRCLTATGDMDQYAADRYWSVLQASGKFLVFKRKFGFQAASFSDIEGAVARYLD